MALTSCTSAATVSLEAVSISEAAPLQGRKFVLRLQCSEPDYDEYISGKLLFAQHFYFKWRIYSYALPCIQLVTEVKDDFCSCRLA